MDSRDRRRFNLRVRLVLVVLLGALSAVLARTAQLQIVEHAALSRLAEGEYLNDVKLPARRGQIYDRSGKPLAISVEVPSVFANPTAVLDPRLAARKLAAVLDLDKTSLYEKLTSERLFVWLKRLVSPDVADRVRQLGLAGVEITPESRRFYPNRELAAHVLGFAGVDGHGLDGIERALDDVLVGEPQVVEALRDGRGRAVLKAGLDPEQRSYGSDATLSIDIAIQHAAEAALHRGVVATRASAGTAVVLDVASADILAMAVEPTFNPNEPASAQAAARRNRGITDMFEPGSSVKPLLIAAALDARVLEPGARVFCENGSWIVGGHTVRDSHPHGWLGLADIVALSSNIGAAKVGERLGREKLEHILRSYGFGRRTGIAFPGETAGLVRDSSAWSSVETATVAFGYSFAVSNLQLAAAYRVLASGGRYREPRLVKTLERSGEGAKSLESPPEVRVLGVESVKRVAAMMEKAVGPDGTGRLAAVPGYRVAGKTGTAHKIDPVTGGYSSDRFTSVFAGFIPADAPQVVITVAIDEPETDHTGGAVAAPVFAEIAEATMRYLGVVPSAALVQASLPAASVPSEEALAPEPAGSASAVRAGTVPSFLGLTAREVVARYAELGTGFALELRGSGRVVRQVPSPGSPGETVRRVTLALAGQ